jgi:hypothetical protein
MKIRELLSEYNVDQTDAINTMYARHFPQGEQSLSIAQKQSAVDDLTRQHAIDKYSSPEYQTWEKNIQNPNSAEYKGALDYIHSQTASAKAQPTPQPAAAPTPNPAPQAAAQSAPTSPTGNLVPGGALAPPKLAAQASPQALQSPEPPPMTEGAMTWEDFLILQEPH